MVLMVISSERHNKETRKSYKGRFRALEVAVEGGARKKSTKLDTNPPTIYL